MSGPTLPGHRCGPKPVDPIKRFWDFVVKADDSCWEYVGRRSRGRGAAI